MAPAVSNQMITRITVKFLAILTVILLSGCAVPAIVSLGLGATSLAVNETTGKTVTDHTVSAVNGKDCRVSRLGKEDICQEETQPVKLKITTTGVTPSSVEEIQAKYK